MSQPQLTPAQPAYEVVSDAGKAYEKAVRQFFLSCLNGSRRGERLRLSARQLAAYREAVQRHDAWWNALHFAQTLRERSGNS
jgi:hypothetical protein